MKSPSTSSKTVIDLTAGKINLSQRNFSFLLPTRLQIRKDDNRAFILITGDNGSGKTSFLELVIIPQLTKNNTCFTLYGQDRALQKLVERSLEAIISVALGNRKEKKQAKPEVLLLDEAEKLLSQEELSSLLLAAPYRIVILISHNPEKLPENKLHQHFTRLWHLHISSQLQQRNIEITKW